MAVNNVQNNLQMLNIASDIQSKNTSKLSSGFKVNRDADTAATLSIKTNVADNVAEDTKLAAMSNIYDIDKVDEMVEKAKANILAKPEESVLAQANVQADGVVNLVQ